MRKFTVIVVFSLLCSLFSVTAYAGLEVSIAGTPTVNWAIGTIGMGVVKETTADKWTVTNGGTDSEDIYIKVDGVDWGPGTVAGADTFVLRHDVFGSWGTPITNVDNGVILIGGLVPTATQAFDLQFTAPTSTTVGGEHTLTVTLTATADPCIDYPCASNDGTGSCVAVADNTRPSGCDGMCERCLSGSCTYQTSEQDLASECTAGTLCAGDFCSGTAASCSVVASGQQGGCPTCQQCDGVNVECANRATGCLGSGHIRCSGGSVSYPTYVIAPTCTAGNGVNTCPNGVKTAAAMLCALCSSCTYPPCAGSPCYITAGQTYNPSCNYWCSGKNYYMGGNTCYTCP